MTDPEFERAGALARATEAEAKVLEDAYLDALHAPQLREDAKRQRRWLVIAALFLVGFWFFGAKPEKIEALGLDLSGTKGNVVGHGLGLVAVYLWLEIGVFASRDLQCWAERCDVIHRRLLFALDLEVGQRKEFLGSMKSRLRTEKDADSDYRKTNYTSPRHPAVKSDWYRVAGHGVPGLIEVALPHVLAGASVALWLYRATQ